MTQTVVSDEPLFFDCLTHFTLLKFHGSAYSFKNTPFCRVEACLSTPKDIPFLICKVSFPTVGLVPKVSWIRGKTIHDPFSLLPGTGHLPVLSCVTQVRVGPPGVPEWTCIGASGCRRNCGQVPLCVWEPHPPSPAIFASQGLSTPAFLEPGRWPRPCLVGRLGC